MSHIDKSVENIIQKKQGEEIKYTLRRHPFTFIGVSLFFIFLLTIPIGVYFLLDNLFAQLIRNEIIYTILVLFGSIYYLSIYLFFFTYFIDFYLDLWVITSERIIDIEQKGLFSRTVSELDLIRIQDVTTNVHGVFPTIFDYGKVNVKTASQNVEIIFKNVPEPSEVRKHIIHFADIEQEQHGGVGDFKQVKQKNK
jgi:membrane protein YdbS with pleckstrin-like domain